MMKNWKSFIKRTVTWLVFGSGLLASGLLVSGIALQGPAGLNLFAWGLVLAPLAAGAIILCACLSFLVGKIRAFTRWIPQAIEAKGNGTRPVQISKSTKSSRMATGSIWAGIPGAEEQQGIEVEVINRLDPSRDSLAAHFNWESGEYDGRGLGGDYDPPYDITKG